MANNLSDYGYVPSGTNACTICGSDEFPCKCQPQHCTCGSGLERYALTDAAGIFCAYVCEKCEPAKRATYNPAIFDGGTRYAGSGEEEDIFADDYREEG